MSSVSGFSNSKKATSPSWSVVDWIDEKNEVKSDELTVVSVENIWQYFDAWRGQLPCFILPNDVQNWTFAFDLYVKKSGFKKYEFIKWTFKTTYEKLKKINQIIQQFEKQKEFFYPSKRYPQPPKPPRNKEKRKCEMKYLSHPKLPKYFVYFNRNSNEQHLKELSEYIQFIFSSPSFLQQDYVYDYFNLPLNIKNIIKLNAQKILRSWGENTTRIISVRRLRKQKRVRFHSCYVVARPISTFNFRHWALKFVGKSSLLTIEFFQEGLIIRTMGNYPSAHRAFWYWWSDQKYKYFNERWKVLERFSTKVTAPDLSFFVENWLLRRSDYNVIDNNCQHFCRDIVAVLNQSKALSLCSLLEHHQVTNFIPIIGWGDSFSEYARTYQISKQLLEKRHKRKRKRERREREQDRERSGDENINNSITNTFMTSSSYTASSYNDSK